MDQRNWDSATEDSAPESPTARGELAGLVMFVGFWLVLIASFYFAVVLKWLEAFGWS